MADQLHLGYIINFNEELSIQRTDVKLKPIQLEWPSFSQNMKIIPPLSSICK